MRGDARLGAACGLLLLSLVIFSQAGPVNRSSRMLGGDLEPTEGTSAALLLVTGPTPPREACTVGDIIYQYGQAVPGSSPCERCLCLGNADNGTEVSCETLQCEVRAGCKALHRADHCCPLYQCECERNGTFYSNGQKLVDLDNPCQVCYCQGGEIVCNKIACFRRNDCEPRYVPGSCCPEYDHCPPSDKDKENHENLKDTTSKQDISLDNEKDTNEPSTTQKKGETSSDEGVTNLFDATPKIDDKNSTPQKIKEINIKEVMYHSPMNNEIRIKEILPITSFDISTGSTKSPTFQRDAPYENNFDSKKIEAFNITEIHDDSKRNDDASQPPPVLRIGDQLLFLKLGDLVPENAAVSTPSPVFTVIGAEGLQRVVDDPEEGFENKNVLSDSMHDAEKHYVIHSTNEPVVEIPVENENNVTAPEDIVTHTKKTKVYEETETSTESSDEMLQEAISDLYETTTKNSMITHSQNNDASSQHELGQNVADVDFSNDSYNDSASTHVESYTEQPQSQEKSILEPHLEEEVQAIPIEHLPEHNPEYPPIPEDIMILSMTEDSLESGSSEIDFSGANPIESHEAKYDEKIVIVKRPVMPLSPPTKNYHIDDSPVKILPDILPFVRINRTNETNSNSESFVPEDWLKATERVDTAPVEFNSPLLTLDSALPDSILRSPSKTSTEEDDSKEYIFIGNNTFKNNYDTLDLSKSDLSTDDPLGQTDIVELEGEFRSPGEPLLIPEWERNQTTDEPDVILNTENSDLYTIDPDNFVLVSNRSEGEDNLLREEIFNKSSVNNFDVEGRLIPESTTENFRTSSLDENGGVVIKDDVFSSSTEMQFTSASADNEELNGETNRVNILKTDTPSDFSDDTITNFIISTEHSDLSPSTDRTSILEHFVTERSANIEMAAEVVRDPETGGLNESAHPQKQKKTSALIADLKNDSGKKHNILADLINLVGDVASIGNHDIEVSTVLNNIDTIKSVQPPKPVKSSKTNNSKDIKRTATNSDQSVDNPNDPLHVELTEYNFSGDKTDIDTPMENEKVEFTTKKSYIDKDSDERNKWKTTDDRDIEIIPKVENKINKKDPSREKIIDDLNNKKSTDDLSNVPPFQDDVKSTTKAPKKEIIVQPKHEDVIIYTTIQTSTILPTTKKVIEDTPNKINLQVDEADPETLISIENIESTTVKEQKDSVEIDTTENSHSSTVMKVTGKNSNMDDQMNILNGNERDKLTKRETNSQLTDSASQIDDSLISILRGFFEQHFSH